MKRKTVFFILLVVIVFGALILVSGLNRMARSIIPIAGMGPYSTSMEPKLFHIARINRDTKEFPKEGVWLKIPKAYIGKETYDRETKQYKYFGNSIFESVSIYLDINTFKPVANSLRIKENIIGVSISPLNNQSRSILFENNFNIFKSEGLIEETNYGLLHLKPDPNNSYVMYKNLREKLTKSYTSDTDYYFLLSNDNNSQQINCDVLCGISIANDDYILGISIHKSMLSQWQQIFSNLQNFINKNFLLNRE